MNTSGNKSMSTSKRSRIILPLVSIVTAFALSAQAQEAPKGPPPKGGPAGRQCRVRIRQARGSQVQDKRVQDKQLQDKRLQDKQVPQVQGAPRAGGLRMGVLRAARRPAISAGTPITAVWPGKADAGARKCTMGAMAGGGTLAAPGIFIRNGWTVRRPMCPILSSWMMVAVRMVRMMERSWGGIHRLGLMRRRPEPMRLHRRHLRVRRMRPQARWGAPLSVDCSVV